MKPSLHGPFYSRCSRHCSIWITFRPCPSTTSRGLRQNFITSQHLRYFQRHSRQFSLNLKWWNSFRNAFRTPPRVRNAKLLLASTGVAALTPGALVTIGQQIREKDDPEDPMTGEEHMLEASRQEIDNQLPDSVERAGGSWKKIYIFIDTYVVEPVFTCLRFLHLLGIFVPVIITVPIIWLGSRVPERHDERIGTIWWYRHLVWSMERAGPAFIKLGQWAASRTDIFPKEMCDIMSSLHSNAPAHSLRKTKRIIEDAFGGMAFKDIFEEFQEKPLGVGAIAQVYKAKLRSDLIMDNDPDVREAQSLVGTVKKNVDRIAKSTPQRIPSNYVAIKVLHPGVERTVRRDLRIMGFFASAINAIPTMEWLSFPDEVKQFGEMMQLQLDLRIEAANLTLFRQLFKNRTTAWFPYPYSDYTTRQVLIEEFANGIPLAAFLENGGGVFQKDIADEVLDAFLHMVLLDNFIHADLHPGNIMLRFYKAAPLVPDQMDIISRVRTVSPGKEKAAPQSPEAQTTDVTEEVLERLRPYRHDAQEWKETLTKIDAEGYRPQLIFIDTGLVTELNHNNRINFLDLFKAVAEFDGYKAGNLMIERCQQPEAVIDKERFALRMQHLVLGVKSRTFALGNIKIGDVLSEVMDMIRGHHVRLEGDFVNVVLSILLLEGIGRTLDPNLDLFEGALPILRQLGTKSGTSMLAGGDFSMLKVWVGLEVRTYLTASAESVEFCVKYDQLSPNV